MNENNQQNNNSINKLESNIFFENLVANLIANELMNYISPSRLKSTSYTEFIIKTLVDIEENQNKILSEIDEIKKTLKKEKNK